MFSFRSVTVYCLSVHSGVLYHLQKEKDSIRNIKTAYYTA